MTSDLGQLGGLQQQNCYGGPIYNVSKTVEQQIAEADPKKLMEWHAQIMKRVSDLYRASSEAYSQLYPQAFPDVPKP